MLIEAALREPLEVGCARQDRRWVHESAPVAAAPDATVSHRTLACAARPDFNDPLVRSLPIWSLAIALAIMENGAASPA